MNKAFFNRSNFIEFKKMYEETEKGGVFVFEGHTFLKEYAKYLIEYLEPQLGGPKMHIYYAHSKMTYGTNKEKEERNFLERTFQVCCPNRDIGERGDIEPYLKKIRDLDGVVCSEYLDHIGRGVYAEIQEALKKKKTVFCLRKQKDGYSLFEVSAVRIVDDTDWKVEYGKVVLSSTSVDEEAGVIREKV